MNLIFLLLVNLIFGDSLSCHTHGWQKNLPGKTINFSKVGNTSGKVFIKLRNSNIQTGSLVFIYAGVNDVYSGVPSSVTVNNLQRSVVLARQKGAKEVYVILGYNPIGVQKNKKLSILYSDLQKKIEKLELAKIIPVCNDITSSDCPDGIHLSAQGNQIFTNHILKYVNSN
jgi:lysophospholipase L1-like esterase